MPEELINKIKDKAEMIVEIASDLKESGSEKIIGSMQDLENSSRVISRSGFNLVEIESKLGIPPEVVAVFKFEKNISDEEWNELFREVESNSTLTALLKALYGADKFADSLKLGKFHLEGVSVILGIPPGVSLKFKVNE